ncbi:MAG: winged helix-turn-helix domain-containing protein [Candidatus Thorarchaeota archaeon]|nr:winged helix-turn-helix domain-containing protein [Candidatus Thorarchaeota archaeon]
MTRPVVHVAVFDKDATHLIAKTIIHRRTDELILVGPISCIDEHQRFLEQYTSLGFQATLVDLEDFSIDEILGTLLNAVDNARLDNFDIEFNVVCNNPVVAIAACLAATMTQSLLITSGDTNLSTLSLLRPDLLLHMSQNKRRILEYLDIQYGPVPQANISRDTVVNRASVSRHLKDLIQAGYVKRTRIGRQKTAEITSLGQVVLHHKRVRKRRVWDHHASSAICFADVGEM